MLSHALFLSVVLPVLLLLLVLERVPNPYSVWINKCEFAVEYAVWCIGLGVLSSIGLGSGLQSGVLFLFPHIIKTLEPPYAGDPVGCLVEDYTGLLSAERGHGYWLDTALLHNQGGTAGGHQGGD
jgi:hypothetical protein